jgi:hypothetical protein
MKKILYTLLFFMVIKQDGFSQNEKYYPKGDPKKFQAEITVPFWIPWIKGDVGVDGLLKDMAGNINATPAKLVENLKATIALNADFRKGSFVGFINYMHLTLETETSEASLPLGRTVTWSDEIKSDILDIAAGGRIHFNKGMVDPFFGVRYFNLSNSTSISDSVSSKSGSSKVDYWDPFFGARVFYYPKERWLLFLRTDFGGIWGGSSEFSWNVEGRVGYTISPTIDLGVGFRDMSFKYAEYTNDSRIFYMNPHMYGFELTAAFMIPKRKSDANVFPKKK